MVHRNLNLDEIVIINGAQSRLPMLFGNEAILKCLVLSRHLYLTLITLIKVT